MTTHKCCLRCLDTGYYLVPGVRCWDDNYGAWMPFEDFCDCTAGRCARADFLKSESKRWGLTASPPEGK